LSLTIDQRLAVLAALESSSCSSFLVFEDDGGGWHHETTVESWVSFSIVPGARYLYNIRSMLHEWWNAETSLIDDERGELRRGTLNIYVCSTNKRSVQSCEYSIADLIERTRMGLSLDYEGVTTGPENVSSRPLGSYIDNRLRKRVYRTHLEVPVLYKFTVIEEAYPIKKIELEPWMGYPVAEMDHLFIRSPLLLSADMRLAEIVPLLIDTSMKLDLVGAVPEYNLWESVIDGLPDPPLTVSVVEYDVWDDVPTIWDESDPDLDVVVPEYDSWDDMPKP
jgi:hypothetical protein